MKKINFILCMLIFAFLISSCSTQEKKTSENQMENTTEKEQITATDRTEESATTENIGSIEEEDDGDKPENTEGISIFDNEETGSAEKDSASFIEAQVAELSAKWNPKNENGEIAKLNSTRSSSHLSAEGVALLKKCITLSQKTNGGLDITLYPLTRLWGFESETPKKPDSSAVSLMHSKCGMETISVSGNSFALEKFTMLDVSAVANGYTADLVSERLLKEGYDATCFSIGDHVRAFGEKKDGSKWCVDLPDVFESGKSYGTLTLGGNLSVSTKGAYQKYYEENGKRYCNIFDPETGKPVDNDLAAVTVICKEGITADAYATACFVLGADESAKFFQANSDFEMILVCKNGEIRVTQGIYDSFSSNNNTEVKVIKK